MDSATNWRPGPPLPSTSFGFDAEHLPRWERMVHDADVWGRLERSFTEAELTEIESSPRGPAAAAAAIWSAKEAVIKARGRREATGVRDVEIYWSADGRRIGKCTREPVSTFPVSVTYAGEFVFAAAWNLLEPASSSGPSTLSVQLDVENA